MSDPGMIHEFHFPTKLGFSSVRMSPEALLFLHNIPYTLSREEGTLCFSVSRMASISPACKDTALPDDRLVAVQFSANDLDLA